MDASPRVGDGLIRLDADGVVQYASPNALSAYHRLGLAADLVGHHLGQTTAELAPARGPVDEALVKLASGWAPREFEVEGSERRHPAAGHPAQAQGRPHRLARPAAGRHRTAPPRAGVDHQGRHHPGDPPPGEEQPPDGGRAAAAPGPPDGLRTAAGRRSTRRCAASVRSRSSTRRCPRTWTSGSSSTRSPTGCWRWSPRSRPGKVDRPAHRPVRHPRRRGRHPAVHGPDRGAAERPGARLRAGGARARSRSRRCAAAPAEEARLLVTVQDDGRGLPEGFDPQRAGNLGLQIVRTLVEGELGGTFDMVPAPERGTRVVLDIPVRAAEVARTADGPHREPPAQQ